MGEWERRTQAPEGRALAVAGGTGIYRGGRISISGAGSRRPRPRSGRAIYRNQRRRRELERRWDDGMPPRERDRSRSPRGEVETGVDCSQQTLHYTPDYLQFSLYIFSYNPLFWLALVIAIRVFT
jgi:hypothetical protein